MVRAARCRFGSPTVLAAPGHSTRYFTGDRDPRGHDRAHRSGPGRHHPRAGRRDRQRGQRRTSTRRRSVRRDLRGRRPRARRGLRRDRELHNGRRGGHTRVLVARPLDRAHRRAGVARRRPERTRVTRLLLPAIDRGCPRQRERPRSRFPPSRPASSATRPAPRPRSRWRPSRRPSPTRSSWCASSHSTSKPGADTSTCSARPPDDPRNYRPAMSDIVEALADDRRRRRGLGRRRDPRRLHARRGAHRDRAAPARGRAARRRPPRSRAIVELAADDRRRRSPRAARAPASRARASRSRVASSCRSSA